MFFLFLETFILVENVLLFHVLFSVMRCGLLYPNQALGVLCQGKPVSPDMLSTKYKEKCLVAPTCHADALHMPNISYCLLTLVFSV